MAPLQLGFIGGGLSSTIGRSHVIASELDRRWKLVSGFFSRTEETNFQTANEWNIGLDRLHTNIEEFIEKEKGKVDAVVVLTPPSNHVETLCRLMEEGIAIICEKPMVASLEDGLIVAEHFKKHPVFFAVTYNYSGYPMVRELRDIIKRESLGNIHRIDFEMPQEGFMRKDPITGKMVTPREWRLKDGSVPTISLDLGIHLHHLAEFLTGKEVLNVMGLYSNNSSYDEVIDDVMMWMEYSDGAKGSFWMSKSAIGNRNGLKLSLYGTKGSATWIQIDPENLHISYQDGRKVTVDRVSNVSVSNELRYNRYVAGHPAGFLEAFANLYSDIADAFIDYSSTGVHNNPYVFGVDHSVSGMKLLDAVGESHRCRTWVNLNR